MKERENDTVDDRGIVTFVNVIPLKGRKRKINYIKLLKDFSKVLTSSGFYSDVFLRT